MKPKTRILYFGLILLLTCCTPKKERVNDMKYSSAITFLYYEDFSYGIHFMENVLPEGHKFEIQQFLKEEDVLKF